LTARPGYRYRPGHRVSRQRKAQLGLLAHAALVAMLAVLAGTLAVAAAPVAVGYRAVVVRGGSMGDSIPNGSLVMARWVPASQIDTGDVILRAGSSGSTLLPRRYIGSFPGPCGGTSSSARRASANQADDPHHTSSPIAS
jgi:hypothetical protein